MQVIIQQWPRIRLQISISYLMEENAFRTSMVSWFTLLITAVPEQEVEVFNAALTLCCSGAG